MQRRNEVRSCLKWNEITANTTSTTEKARLLYAYPDSGDENESRATADRTETSKPLPLSQRLRALQAELSSLEGELADPSNPLLQQEREESNVDPGELLRGLVDVRSRLGKIVKEKEGRAKLVDNLLHESKNEIKAAEVEAPSNPEAKAESPKSGVQRLVEVDRRVEELERLVGSSSMSLDDVRSTESVLSLKCAHLPVDDIPPTASTSPNHSTQQSTLFAHPAATS